MISDYRDSYRTPSDVTLLSFTQESPNESAYHNSHFNTDVGRPKKLDPRLKSLLNQLRQSRSMR